jgi:hypothetical protein
MKIIFNEMRDDDAVLTFLKRGDITQNHRLKLSFELAKKLSTKG